MFKKKILIVLLIALYTLTGTLNADEYANTSYYVAYDKDDAKQYVLVLPSVNKAYTHEAGHIAASDLKRVDDQFESFPTYNDGNLCFSALTSDATGENGADKMEEKCYEVNFFYTQKEIITEGVAFILFYAPSDKVYEGLAGDAGSFEVVREGSVVHNENSITGDDYTNFAFNVKTGTVEGVVDEGSNTTLTSNLLVGKTFYVFDGEISTVSFTETSMIWDALFSNDDGNNSYSIANNGIIVQDDDDEVHVSFVREESDRLLFELGEKSIIFYKTLSAFQTYLETLIPSNGIKTDPDNDSVNRNVANDGFELTSLKTEIVNNTLVIEVKAKSSILNAIKTTPRANFNNILWVTISNDYEYGLMADGHYMRKDHYDANHEWQWGTEVSEYTSEILSDGVKITLPLSALSQEIKDLGYLNIGVEIADDHDDAVGADETEDEEHMFDTIESMVKIPMSTGGNTVTELLAGKTVYGVSEDNTMITALSFNSGMTAISGENASDTWTDSIVNVTDTTITSRDESGDFVITLVEATVDYLVINTSTKTNTRLYFDETKAQAYFFGATASALVGTWYINDAEGQVTVTFFADGNYILAESGTADADGQSGIERGTYTYNSTAGTLTSVAQVDTNGEWGLSHTSGGSLGIEITNNQLTLIEGTDRYTATLVENVDSSIIGSWYFNGSTDDPNKLIVITFLADGTYMMAEDSVADDTGGDGMELGTYIWDARTGAFQSTTTVDTNGEWGLSHTGNGMVVTIQNNTLSFTIPNDEGIDFTKVPH